MAKVRVTGASDDLVEVDGDLSEEFYALTDRKGRDHGDADDGGILAFSDGTVLDVAYTDQGEGIWRITPLARGSALVGIEQAAVDDEDSYSDTATLDGDVRWVVFGREFKTAKA